MTLQSILMFLIVCGGFFAAIHVFETVIRNFLTRRRLKRLDAYLDALEAQRKSDYGEGR